MTGKTKLIGIPVAIMLAAGIGTWWMTLNRDQCLEEAGRIALPHSTWVVITQYSACGGAVVGGYTEVIARDSATQKQELLLHIDNLENVRTAIASPSELAITLPNVSDITEMKKRFAGMDIVYRFTPRDDPEERANYQLWRHHPSDPKAVAWWCDRLNQTIRREDLQSMREFYKCD